MANNNLIIGVVVVVVLLALLGGFGRYGMTGGFNPGFMLLNFLFSIIVIIVIITGIYWLFKNVDFTVRRRR